MNNVTCVIIDDEVSAVSTLTAILKNYFENVEILGVAHNVKDGVKVITEKKPQIVFLDIKMPDGTGFDLLKRVERNFEVIFTTAFDNYAINAFKSAACGYLMKPIDIDQLGSALDKAIPLVQNTAPDMLDKKIGVVVENYTDAHGQIKKIVIPNMDGFEVVDIKDLIRCSGERNYTHFILTDGRKVLTSTTLREYDELLSAHGFYRIHKSHLINLHHVRKYVKNDGGGVEMS